MNSKEDLCGRSASRCPGAGLFAVRAGASAATRGSRRPCLPWLRRHPHGARQRRPAHGMRRDWSAALPPDLRRLPTPPDRGFPVLLRLRQTVGPRPVHHLQAEAAGTRCRVRHQRTGGGPLAARPRLQTLLPRLTHPPHRLSRLRQAPRTHRPPEHGPRLRPLRRSPRPVRLPPLCKPPFLQSPGPVRPVHPPPPRRGLRRPTRGT
jgi:hypothetical protein